MIKKYQTIHLSHTKEIWNNLKVKRDNFNSAYVDRIIQSDKQWGDLTKNEEIALGFLRDGMKDAEDRLPEIQGDVHQMNN